MFTNSWTDLFVNHDYSRIADLHEDFVQHDLVSGMEVHGYDELEEKRRMYDAAFSDLAMTNVLSFADDDGEYVCSVDTYQCTHDGEFMGYALSALLKILLTGHSEHALY